MLFRNATHLIDGVSFSPTRAGLADRRARRRPAHYGPVYKGEGGKDAARTRAAAPTSTSRMASEPYQRVQGTIGNQRAGPDLRTRQDPHRQRLRGALAPQDEDQALSGRFVAADADTQANIRRGRRGAVRSHRAGGPRPPAVRTGDAHSRSSLGILQSSHAGARKCLPDQGSRGCHCMTELPRGLMCTGERSGASPPGVLTICEAVSSFAPARR